MDFHLLEGSSKRPKHAAQTAGAWHIGPGLGQQRSNNLIRMKEAEWHRAFALLRKVAEKQKTTKQAYKLALKVLNTKMLSPEGKQFADEFKTQTAMTLLNLSHKATWTNKQDVTSIDPGIPTLLQKADAADHVTALDLDDIDPEDTEAFDNNTSVSKRVISRVVSLDKPSGLHDPLIVYSGVPEEEPYYILTRIHKESRTGDIVPGRYELTVPPGFDYRRGKNPPGLEYREGKNPLDTVTHMGITQYSDFKKLYRTDSPSSLVVIHTLSTQKPFKEIITPLMAIAWRKSKLYFAQRMKLIRARKDLKHLPSHMGSEARTYLEGKINVQLALLQGKMPAQKYRAIVPKEVSVWPRIKAGMGESATWYVWLLAAEDEYGVRLPNRQNMYTHKPQRRAYTKGQEGSQPLRNAVKSRQQGWNQDILASLGLGRMTGDPSGTLTRVLKNSNYRFNASEDEINRIWVIAPRDYIEHHNLAHLPADITDAVRNSTRRVSFNNKEITLLGKVNGQIKAKRNQNRIVGYETKLGTARKYMLVNARAWLKLFDSPQHGGERLQHTLQGPKIVRSNPVWLSSHSKTPRDTMPAGVSNRRKLKGRRYNVSRHKQGTPSSARITSNIQNAIQQKMALNKALDQVERQLGLNISRTTMFSSTTRATLAKAQRLQSMGDAKGRAQAVRYIVSQNPAPEIKALEREKVNLAHTTGMRRKHPPADLSKLTQAEKDKIKRMNNPMYTSVYNKEQDRDDVTLVPGISKPEQKKSYSFATRKQDTKKVSDYLQSLRDARQK